MRVAFMTMCVSKRVGLDMGGIVGMSEMVVTVRMVVLVGVLVHPDYSKRASRYAILRVWGRRIQPRDAVIGEFDTFRLRIN